MPSVHYLSNRALRLPIFCVWASKSIHWQTGCGLKTNWHRSIWFSMRGMSLLRKEPFKSCSCEETKLFSTQMLLSKAFRQVSRYSFKSSLGTKR